MLVTRKHLPRRTFLKGVGTAIALPFLDSMVPAFAAPSATQAPESPLLHIHSHRRHHGTSGIPTGGEKDFQFKRILKPYRRFP